MGDSKEGPQKNNDDKKGIALGVISLVCGVVGDLLILLYLPLAIMLLVFAIIMAILSLVTKEREKGLAIGALLISIIIPLMGLIAVIAIYVLFLKGNPTSNPVTEETKQEVNESALPMSPGEIAAIQNDMRAVQSRNAETEYWNIGSASTMTLKTDGTMVFHLEGLNGQDIFFGTEGDGDYERQLYKKGKWANDYAFFKDPDNGDYSVVEIWVGHLNNVPIWHIQYNGYKLEFHEENDVFNYYYIMDGRRFVSSYGGVSTSGSSSNTGTTTGIIPVHRDKGNGIRLITTRRIMTIRATTQTMPGERISITGRMRMIIGKIIERS